MANKLWIGCATVCGIGYAPIAPGTFGAVAGVGIYLAVAKFTPGPLAFAVLLVTSTLLGIRASDIAERHR